MRRRLNPFYLAAFITLHGLFDPGPEPPHDRVTRNGIHIHWAHPPKHGRLGKQSQETGRIARNRTWKWFGRPLRGNTRGTTKNGAFGKPVAGSAVVGTTQVTLGTGIGYTFGPVANPASTTYGFAEAFNVSGANSITNPASPNYGKALYVYATGAMNFTTQIIIPSGVTVYMPNQGGEGYGPVYSAPTTYLNYTGPANSTALPYPNAANQLVTVLIADQSSNVTLYGFAVVANVAGINAVMEVTGSRGVYSENLSVFSNQLSTIGLLCDGYVSNCEDNSFISPFSSADIAYQFGLTGEAQHFNDSTFYDITGEGHWTGSHFVVSSGMEVINHIGGTNIQLYNFYSRGNTFTNLAGGATQIYMHNVTGVPQMRLWDGEQRAATGGNGGLWHITDGTLTVMSGSWSEGIVTLDGSDGAIVMMASQRTNGATTTTTLNQSNGTFQWDETCVFGNSVNSNGLTYAMTGGVCIPPRRTASQGPGTFGMASFTNSGGIVECARFTASDVNGYGLYTPNNGGIQQFITDCQSGLFDAGASHHILEVAPNYPTQATLNVTGPTNVAYVAGFTIDTGIGILDPKSTAPAITALTYSSSTNLVQNTTIAGFVINQLTITGTTNNGSKNCIRRCLFQSSGSATTITINNNTGGFEYFDFYDCWGSDGEGGQTTPAPFIVVEGTNSGSMGHYYFHNFKHLIADGASANPNIFLQINGGVSFGPPIIFKGLDLTTLRTSGTPSTLIVNFPASTSSTQCDVHFESPYFEGRPITFLTMGAYTGGGTYTGQIECTGARINTSVPFTISNNTNTSFAGTRDSGLSFTGHTAGNPDTSVVLSATIAQASGATPAVITGLGLGNANWYVRVNVTNGPRGFNISTPALSGINLSVNAANIFNFPIEISFTAAGTATAIVVTDQHSTSKTYTLQPTVIDKFILNPGEQIAVTYSVAPTWVWRGL